MAFMYPITSPLLRANDCYGIFHAFPEDYFANNRLLGGWDTRSPSYSNFKARNGLLSLPRDLIGSDVCLVAPSLDRLTQYFSEAYGVQAGYKNVTQLGGSNLTAVRAVEIKPEEE
jgi:hypothetical protein